MSAKIMKDLIKTAKFEKIMQMFSSHVRLSLKWWRGDKLHRGLLKKLIFRSPHINNSNFKRGKYTVFFKTKCFFCIANLCII